MKESVSVSSRAVDEALGRLLENLERGVVWAEGQAPLLAQEIVNFGIMSSWILLGVGVLLVLFGVAVMAFAVWVDTETAIGLFLLGIPSLIIGIVVVCTNIVDLVKAYTAPRLFVVERIMEIAKGGLQ